MVFFLTIFGNYKCSVETRRILFKSCRYRQFERVVKNEQQTHFCRLQHVSSYFSAIPKVNSWIPLSTQFCRTEFNEGWNFTLGHLNQVRKNGKNFRPNGVYFLNPEVEKPLTPIFEPNRSKKKLDKIRKIDIFVICFIMF